jgi:glutamyl-tRNA reductase
MALVALGITFRNAPLALRERWSFSATQARAALDRLRQTLPGLELMLLSTCNRTELYAAATDAGLLESEALASALVSAEADPEGEFRGHLYVQRDREAMAHLMAVATGLDSLVVGETEILGQVKQAYQLALDAGTAGRHLNTLAQQVFRVAKRVRNETELARGHVSVGSVAVQLSGKVFDDLGKKTVLIIGAGKIGELAMRALVAKGVKGTYVLNRSQERARAIAEEYHGIALPLERLPDFLPQADIVISSTSAPGCILDVAAVRTAMATRHGRPMLLVDLAVPRDIAAEVGGIDNVYLYNLDDLEDIANQNLAKRQGALEGARRIVQEEVAAVADAMQADALGIGAVMRRLDDTAAEIREAELARVFAKDKVAPLGPACDACRDEICIMLQRALAKMVAGPKKALAEAARSGDFEEFVRVAARLYGIGEDASGKTPKEQDET